MQNAIEHNGIQIVRTPTGIGVHPINLLPRYQGSVLVIEIDYAGRRLNNDAIFGCQPWCYFTPGVDMLRCGVRVKVGDAVLAELGLPTSEPTILPFMVLQGEQHHVTENYCAVPPCLTITDEVGAVWTLGFETARKDDSPEGEFAFPVLRDGVDVHEIASRIERRNGKIRVLTKSGWKRWTGQSFF